MSEYRDEWGGKNEPRPLESRVLCLIFIRRDKRRGNEIRLMARDDRLIVGKRQDHGSESIKKKKKHGRRSYDIVLM